MLGAGEADAFAATWPVMRAIAEMEGMIVHNSGPTGHSYPLAVGYRSDQPVLGSIMQKALDASPPLLAIFEGSAGSGVDRRGGGVAGQQPRHPGRLRAGLVPDRVR